MEDFMVFMQGCDHSASVLPCGRLGMHHRTVMNMLSLIRETIAVLRKPVGVHEWFNIIHLIENPSPLPEGARVTSVGEIASETEQK